LCGAILFEKGGHDLWYSPPFLEAKKMVFSFTFQSRKSPPDDRRFLAAGIGFFFPLRKGLGLEWGFRHDVSWMPGSYVAARVSFLTTVRALLRWRGLANRFSSFFDNHPPFLVWGGTPP